MRPTGAAVGMGGGAAGIRTGTGAGPEIGLNNCAVFLDGCVVIFDGFSGLSLGVPEQRS